MFRLRNIIILALVILTLGIAWSYYKKYKEAEKLKKEAILEARQNIFDQKREFERDMKERKQVVLDFETKISQRD
jgi:Tfp pilus assembly major pilin PilA